MDIHYIFVMLTVNSYNFVKPVDLWLSIPVNTAFQNVPRFTIFWGRGMLRH